MSEQSQRTQSEWPQFMVLVIISVGLILVIALLRPFIFNRVVPAILGPFDTETAVTISEPVIDAGSNIEQTGSGMEESTDESGTGDSEEDITEAEDTGATEETAVDTEEATTRTHTVATGETVNQIARLYGVPVQEIIVANKLANPDVLRIGQELIIPTKE